MSTIGIRREDKHDYEARAPLTPSAVRDLVDRGIGVVVQPSTIRAFDDGSYRQAGATVTEDLSKCDIVWAVKEIPKERLRAGGAYVFFSHTIKGQAYNMPLLRRLMELGCTLIDYEKITDANGRRLVFFGRHAGLAGMIDTFSVLGSRLATLGHDTAFARLNLAHQYADLEAAEQAVSEAGKALGELPESLCPLVFGFAGYGNVSRGAQQIFDRMPHVTIEPSELASLVASGKPRDQLVKVVFKEEHLARPNTDRPFVLQEYYDHPDRFEGAFANHADQLSVLINAIYWTDAYPRLLSRSELTEWAEAGRGRLLVVGDISCDIDGAVECTVKATTPNAPVYLFDPRTGEVTDGVEGKGLAMMTTDCLPCELPRESTAAFTEALLPFVAQTAGVDFTGELADADLPEPIRRATILWRGELTDDFAYLREHVRS